MKYMIIGLLLLTVTACTYTNRVSKVYDQENTAVAFRGILDVIKQTDKNVNVLFVHGMRGYSFTNGISDPCRVANTIRERLSTDPLVGDSEKTSSRYCQGWLAYQGKRIYIQPNFWGNLTFFTKYALNGHDNDPNIETDRTKITSRIKSDLINDGFADALMYIGDSHQNIIDNLTQSIRRMESQNPNSVTIIVTFSLGSKVVLDTIKQLGDKGQLGLLENNVEMIYMMANQVPLLNTGSINGLANTIEERKAKLSAEYENLGLVLKSQVTTASSKDNISIVAFTDPNDILSYTLNPETMGTLKDAYVNVAISVAQKTLYIPSKRDYGVVNYLTAHTGYVHNNKVRTLLMDGFEPSTEGK